MSKDINVTIDCKNIAPITYMFYSVNTSSLKYAVFANNGSGKTYLSRLFRLLEKPGELSSDKTDFFITKGFDSGSFSFLISDSKETKENVAITFHRGQSTIVPQSQYIFHTYNQDFVDENVQALNYSIDGNIQGYILGKSNIDLSKEEHELSKITAEGQSKRDDLVERISKFISQKTDSIRDIKKLSAYRDYLNIDSILKKNPDTDIISGIKTISDYISEYNKVKSVPEGLSDIPLQQLLNVDKEHLKLIETDLGTSFSVSTFAAEFKQKLKGNLSFYESGVHLFKSSNGTCPFCGQEVTESAISLIDSYNQFLNDQESKTQKRLHNHIEWLSELKKQINGRQTANKSSNNKMSFYKNHYMDSIDDSYRIHAAESEILSCIDCIISSITLKQNNLTTEIHDNNCARLITYVTDSNSIIAYNNNLINAANNKLHKVDVESRNIRKNLCLAVFNTILEDNKEVFRYLAELRDKCSLLKKEISTKRESERIDKKQSVHKTISTVLNYFFSGKYTLSEDSFLLSMNNSQIEEGQTKHVLSEGEKNIIAFAYYLGEAHLKVTNEDDYSKLYFIIDDPISSMDYSHVYTMSGVIRNLNQILNKIGHERFIVLTHNNDFMRILCANNIAGNSFILRDGTISPFNINFTVPYISHLLDIYKIAFGQSSPNHTTANSIRHIIETLTKFDSIEVCQDSIDTYIKEHFDIAHQSYTMINDLSHGGWRGDQSPITDKDYKDICISIIKHVKLSFPNQIAYCEKICKRQ